MPVTCDLLPAPLPDVSRVDPGVQAQVRGRYETLNRAIADKADAPELAAAYGQYGMVLQAAEYYDVAEPCYLNAQKLAPDEIRWPYYLASLYKSRGETDKAEAAFKRALELRPDDLATLIWLGRLHLDQGRRRPPSRSLRKPWPCAADGGRAGRTWPGRRRQTRLLAGREVPRRRPGHRPRSREPACPARRGLPRARAAGQGSAASSPVAQSRPLRARPAAAGARLAARQRAVVQLRGVRAFEARDWPSAVAYFRKGIGLARDNTPLSRSLHHKLGTALYLTGDCPGRSSNSRTSCECARGRAG